MTKALITESYLSDIADSIRAKLGTQREFTPGQMSEAIDQISGGGVTVESLSVTANDTYTAPAGKAYSPVIVNVPGGGSTNILSGTDAPTSGQGSDGDVYLEYGSVMTTNGSQYFDTGVAANTQDLAMEIRYTPSTSGNCAIAAGTWSASGFLLIQFNSHWRMHDGGKVVNTSASPVAGEPVTIKVIHGDGLYIDGVLANSLSGASANASSNIRLFGNISGQDIASLSAQIEYIKFWSGTALISELIPAIDPNNVACFYDSVLSQYNYDLSGTPPTVVEGIINSAHLKVSGAWQNLMGSNISDVNLGS